MPVASREAYVWRSVAEERAAVVAEAFTWLRTPYHHHARLKGVGCDCAQFPAAVYEACGIVPHLEPRYPRDWHLHRSEELYLGWVRRFACEIEEACVQPGDFIVWRWGRTFSHGGIVVAAGQVIHAYMGLGVTLDAFDQHEELKERPRLMFSVWRG